MLSPKLPILLSSIEREKKNKERLVAVPHPGVTLTRSISYLVSINTTLNLKYIFLYNLKCTILLGQRPYNDDSLLTDSMVIEETQMVDIENDRSFDLNATQVSEQANEGAELLKDEEMPVSDLDYVNKSSSPSHDKSTMKSEVTISSNPTKKINASKKKRASDIK